MGRMTTQICAWPLDGGCAKPAAKSNWKQRKFCEDHGRQGGRANAAAKQANREIYLPFGPLGELIEARGDLTFTWYSTELVEANPERNRIEKNLSRAKARGLIRWDIADEICCHMLRLHPAEVFGDIWWLDPEEI